MPLVLDILRHGAAEAAGAAGDSARPHLKLREIFSDVFSWMTAPAVEGLQYGHVSRKLTLPFGLQAQLDANRGTLSVLESAVE